MLTPDDIRNITFTKTMGGYKTVEVDTFIGPMRRHGCRAGEGKGGAVKKLEVLADKLVEYRNEEDSIPPRRCSAPAAGGHRCAGGQPPRPG